MDNFRRLVAALTDYDQFGRPEAGQSARAVVGSLIGDPLLVEMLFCPVLFYGGAREHDMDFGQFSILFRSIFLEGLARPLAGVRLILKRLVRKFCDLGGELRLRSGVARILVKDGRADRVVLDDGSELAARNVLSSAGWLETMRLCDGRRSPPPRPADGLSIVESISVLNRQPRALGHERTMVFFNDSREVPLRETGRGRRPPQRHRLLAQQLPLRRAAGRRHPADHRAGQLRPLVGAWTESDYRRQKRRWYERMVASAVRFVPDFRPAVIETDMFTPLTIRRFTGHDKGAIFGARKNATTAPRT